jgi:hypothetical protein
MALQPPHKLSQKSRICNTKRGAVGRGQGMLRTSRTSWRAAYRLTDRHTDPGIVRSQTTPMRHTSSLKVMETWVMTRPWQGRANFSVRAPSFSSTGRVAITPSLSGLRAISGTVCYFVEGREGDAFFFH